MTSTLVKGAAVFTATVITGAAGGAILSGAGKGVTSTLIAGAPTTGAVGEVANVAVEEGVGKVIDNVKNSIPREFGADYMKPKGN